MLIALVHGQCNSLLDKGMFCNWVRQQVRPYIRNTSHNLTAVILNADFLSQAFKRLAGKIFAIQNPIISLLYTLKTNGILDRTLLRPKPKWALAAKVTSRVTHARRTICYLFLRNGMRGNMTSCIVFVLGIFCSFFPCQSTSWEMEREPFFNQTINRFNPNTPQAPLQILSSFEQHKSAFINAFQTAQSSILITNYGKLFPNLLPLLEELVPPASKRGVRIYVRFNYDKDKDQRESNPYPPIPDEIQALFEQYNVNVARIKTHAKILAVDHTKVIMGSFNWLTDLTWHPPSFNRSLVFSGENCPALVESVWDVLKYYRNKKYAHKYAGNRRAVYQFRRTPSNQDSKVFSVNPASQLTYVHLIDEHRRKLLKVFEQAQDHIIMLSPFVSYDGRQTYQRDFVYQLLETVLQRCIHVCFVCLPCHRQKIETYLRPLLITYPTLLYVVPHDKLHAKTLIVDNSLIAEGSFNWLCPVRDEVSNTHKQEATLICEGDMATQLIQDFNQTNLGQQLQQILSSSKRHPVNSPDTNSTFFWQRRYAVETEIWADSPLWVAHNSGYHYLVYEQYFDVMSGFNQQGFCARANKGYLRDASGQIRYFPTLQQAKAATFAEYLEPYF